MMPHKDKSKKSIFSKKDFYKIEDEMLGLSSQGSFPGALDGSFLARFRQAMLRRGIKLSERK